MRGFAVPRRTRRSFVATLLVAFACTALLAGQGGRGQQPLRLLFIGNSYTYFNNLPEMFAKLAEAGQHAVETAMVAPGGWRLRDHWERGLATKVLHEGQWDYVVLQEQSTLGVNAVIDGQPRVTSDEVFQPYADKWAAEVRKAGARPVFYLTWARKATPDDQSVLNAAYMRAARASHGTVAPVGIAWSEVRQRHRSIELFYADGSHPSTAGTYLAACTFYATIFDASPEGLPARIVGHPVNLDTAQVAADKTAVLVDLSPVDARVLQAAAWSAWRGIR